MKIVAWMTELWGVVSLVAAETRGQAVATTIKACRAAGYKPQWRQARAVRHPKKDAWAATATPKRCTALEDAR